MWANFRQAEKSSASQVGLCLLTFLT